MFQNKYKGKKVLITGHTGFKGSWLTVWLLKLGAKICGVSDSIPTNPSMFEKLALQNKIESHFCDIRDIHQFSKILKEFNPDFLFHLAAQPIVSISYEDPLNTISTNVMGTAVVLESLKQWNQECNVVIITSDKCYENVEWVWGYKENDHLGGKDIYSGSKGAAEIIFHSYYHSYFNCKENKIKLATGRAGNVIGGGDWARDRIVVDCVKNWSLNKIVEIRSPKSTRPWQHVLEPLSGYLTLGAQLESNDNLLGESFNFGPKSEQNRTVLELITDLSKHWHFSNIDNAYKVTDNIPFHEAGLLKLNCDKALFHLKWEANLAYSECVNMVGEWYFSFYRLDTDMYNFTMDQISKYENLGEEKKIDLDTKLINLEGIKITQLKKIQHPRGDIYHALKCTDESFKNFGEAYFTTIHKGDVKGWKKHLKMCMNLIVPVGEVCFQFYNENLNKGFSINAGENNYIRITVQPGVWMAFQGVSEGLNLILNIASIPHDPTESINVDIKNFPFN